MLYVTAVVSRTRRCLRNGIDCHRHRRRCRTHTQICDDGTGVPDANATGGHRTRLEAARIHAIGSHDAIASVRALILQRAARAVDEVAN